MIIQPGTTYDGSTCRCPCHKGDAIMHFVECCTLPLTSLTLVCPDCNKPATKHRKNCINKNKGNK